MQRKEAEKLLAALIFDDLDETSKTELLNYLQTDNELRERLADMRMAAKVASDTVQHGPDPILGKRRLKHLAKLTRHQRSWTTFLTAPRLAAAAVIFIVAALVLSSIQSYPRVRRYAPIEANERVPSYKLSLSDAPESAPSDSESRRTHEITSITGQYAFEPPVRGSEVVDMGYAFDPAIRGPEVGERIKEKVGDRIEELMDSAKVLQGQMRYDEALGQLESLLVLDPMNNNALIQKQTLEDMINYRRQIEVERKKSKDGIDVLRKTDEASIPYAGNLTYPDRWQEIIARPYRKPEEPLGQGHYAYDPVARGPEVIDSITSVNNETDFTKNKIGGSADIQLFSIHGYADSSPKTGPTNSWDSGSIVAGSTLEGGQSSEMREGSSDDVGEYRPWWARDHRADYGDKNGDGIVSYHYPGGGFGGMGGGGGSGGGIMAPSPGGVYGWVGGGGMGGYGGGYGGSMGSYGMGGYSNYSVPSREFYFHSGRDSSAEGLKAGNRGDAGSGDTLNGVMSGDMLGFPRGTYDGDIEFEGKETNLLTKPDIIGVVTDGDSIAVGGSVFFQNGQAVDTTIDGSTVKIIDHFEVYNDGVPSPVTVDVGKPVTFATPELTQPLKPTGGGADISEMPGLKLKTDEGKDLVVWEETKENVLFGDWWRRESHSEDEAFGRKTGKEVNTRRHQLVPEKVKPVKPPVPGFPGSGLVEQDQRQGDVSKEGEEESTGEFDEKSVSSLKKDISRFPQPTDEIKALLGTKTKPSADDVSSTPVGGPAGKEEGKRIPILGDIPILGRLYSKKRTWTDEEEKEIIAHLAHKKLQPQGEQAGLEYETIKLKHLDPRQAEDSISDNFKDMQDILKDMSVTGDQSKLLTLALPKNRQLIVFGSKDQREAVRNMVNAIDIPPGQSSTESAFSIIGEDEPDLPPSSRFKLVPVNPWVMAERDSLSTFALDVDTASYTLCRRYIHGGFLPPAGAVRMEEFVNYFNYHYPQRTNPTFKIHAEAAPSPFARREQNLTLLKIGVKARTIGRDQRKAAHLIIVVDASASMDQPDRLPLVQRALGLLVNKLSAVDRVSLITCANEARLHLESVPARERGRIRQAIYAIQPAGPTNLLAGLKLGYATARRTFAPKQINHVVLCSDGVANVGQTEAETVLEEVAADRKQGITITCVGVGYGSYNDVFLEALANQGDGSYMFLDSARQVHRVFVRQLAATLQTVAKDARIQVDFNPNRVRRYRLIGYENRDIEDKRFRDDTIDAGEVGSGQCSTALYELELVGQPSADRQEDLGTVFVRYRDVETGQFEEISSRLSSATVRRHTVESAPRFFLAAGAARFAEILRQSEHAQHGNLMDVLRVVEQVSLALPLDRDVRELAELIRKSENLPRSP